jgi:hypothetical protein
VILQVVDAAQQQILRQGLADGEGRGDRGGAPEGLQPPALDGVESVGAGSNPAILQRADPGEVLVDEAQVEVVAETRRISAANSGARSSSRRGSGVAASTLMLSFCRSAGMRTATSVWRSPQWARSRWTPARLASALI